MNTIGNTQKWWTGKIVAIGDRAQIIKKAAAYEAQLDKTRNPVLHETFTEDLQSGDHETISSDSDEPFTPVIREKLVRNYGLLLHYY